MFRKVLLVLVLTVCLFTFSGCDSFRFAPTQAQKQIALDAQRAAMTVEALGTDPASEAAKKLLTGTSVMLNYAGLPDDPVIEDFETTAQQAAEDAAQRPTSDDIFEAADQALGLAEMVLIILGGTSGAGLGIAGALKIAGYISAARKKTSEAKGQYDSIYNSAAEVIRAQQIVREKLKDGDPKNTTWASADILEMLKDSNNAAQSPNTQQLVNDIKANIPN
jgi:hypothetical protein